MQDFVDLNIQAVAESTFNGFRQSLRQIVTECVLFFRQLAQIFLEELFKSLLVKLVLVMGLSEVDLTWIRLSVITVGLFCLGMSYVRG